MPYEQHHAFAQRVLPGGVCATAWANRAVGHPLYVARGRGARVVDIEGREFFDMCVSHGASLLGHDHPAITAAVREALAQGVVCSYETEDHAALVHEAAVADRDAVRAMVAASVASSGRLDAVVTSHAHSVREPIAEASWEGIRRTLEVMQLGVVHVVQLAVQQMLRQEPLGESRGTST